MDNIIIEKSPEEEEESLKTEEATSNSINNCSISIALNMNVGKKDEADSDDDEEDDNEEEDVEEDDDEEDDDAKDDNVKVDNVKVDNVKVDNVKVDNVKVDNIKVDNVKVDNVKKYDNVKVDNAKNDEDDDEEDEESEEDSEEEDSENGDSSNDGSEDDNSEDDASEEDDSEEDDAEDGDAENNVAEDDEDNDESVNADNSDEEKKVYSGWPEKSAEEKIHEVRKKLIMTAQMERLNDYVDARLMECGWKANLKSILRAEIKKNSNLTLENLFDCVKGKGKELISDSLKGEMLDKIQELYEAKVPDFTASENVAPFLMTEPSIAEKKDYLKWDLHDS